MLLLGRAWASCGTRSAGSPLQQHTFGELCLSPSKFAFETDPDYITLNQADVARRSVSFPGGNTASEEGETRAAKQSNGIHLSCAFCPPSYNSYPVKTGNGESFRGSSMPP